MDKIVELPSVKPRSTSRHRGLRKLSPDLIAKARDETATQVTRVGLTFVGTTAFCLLSLSTPDIALLAGSERINVPLAGPVSFFGFMLLGPAVLIALRGYLQIYVEHGDRLDRLARSVSIVRAPTLVPLDNGLIRLLSGFVFYVLLPVATLLFAWKAAVFPTWGLGLFGVAVAVIVSHVMLPLGKLSWRLRGLLAVSAAIIAGVVMHGLGPPHRPFNLFRANLAGQWLPFVYLHQAYLAEANLSKANLSEANLSGADLGRANLSEANLAGANLSPANLRRPVVLHSANLTRANLRRANLSGAYMRASNLSEADLGEANLSGALLHGADLIRANLSRANLSGAHIRGANLSRAPLAEANLRGADLIQADLSGADLARANLNGADLRGANLKSVYLAQANLSGADLRGATLSAADPAPAANLRGANLSGANLGDAVITQMQLDEACGNADTKLPKDLTIKPCH